MSGGWIKVEKDLRSDPRVLRMARQLCNARPLQGVTQVLGGLLQLWFMADTYIGNDNILPLGIDEINEVIGIEGFCQLIPEDWLRIVDTNNVELPDYHIHNGTIAKAKAQTQKRVKNHRKQRNDTPLQVCNARPLPDQDQDQDLKKKIDKRKNASRLPDDWQPSAQDIAYAQGQRVNPVELAEAFRDYWHASATPTARKLDWAAAWRTWCRYEGKLDNGRRPPRGPAQPDVGAQLAALSAHAAQMGFRTPWPLESPEAYRTALKLHETTSSKGVMARIQARLGSDSKN